MEKLSLYYPVSPHKVNRAWGVQDDLYKKFGFVRHNGVDLDLVEGQEIRAPFDAKVTLVGFQLKGSGTFLCLVSNAVYEFDDGKSARVELTFMHVQKACVTAGTKVSVGDLIALGGHTGETTGDHVHIAPKRVTRGLLGYKNLDRNDADSTFDPEPYWNGSYATRTE